MLSVKICRQCNKKRIKDEGMYEACSKGIESLLLTENKIHCVHHLTHVKINEPPPSWCLYSLEHLMETDKILEPTFLDKIENFVERLKNW